MLADVSDPSLRRLTFLADSPVPIHISRLEYSGYLIVPQDLPQVDHQAVDVVGGDDAVAVLVNDGEGRVDTLFELVQVALHFLLQDQAVDGGGRYDAVSCGGKEKGRWRERETPWLKRSNDGPASKK